MRYTPETESGIPHVTVQGGHQRASFLVVVPTFGMVAVEHMIASQALAAPVNAGVHSYVIKGEEIGIARNRAAQTYLSMGDKRPKYLFFFGDDMIPEWWHLVALHEEMEKGQWDVLAGNYYLKQDDVPVPIMWRTGTPGPLLEGVHFKPGEVVQSDICGMDFTLIRPEAFEKIDPPYFKTSFVHGDQWSDLIYDDGTDEPSKGRWLHTEDAWFCRKLKEAGGKIGVHTGVRVGHLDISSGEIY